MIACVFSCNGFASAAQYDDFYSDESLRRTKPADSDGKRSVSPKSLSHSSRSDGYVKHHCSTCCSFTLFNCSLATVVVHGLVVEAFIDDCACLKFKRKINSFTSCLARVSFPSGLKLNSETFFCHSCQLLELEKFQCLK